MTAQHPRRVFGVRRLSRRPSRATTAITVVALLGAVIFFSALAAEVHHSVQRVDAISISYVSSEGPVHVSTADRRRSGQIRRSWTAYALRLNEPLRPMHWRVNTTTHESALVSGFPEGPTNIFMLFRWSPAGTVIPMAAGLALLLGALFCAAVRWRPAARAG